MNTNHSGHSLNRGEVETAQIPSRVGRFASLKGRDRTRLAVKLENWFRQHARDLPWRRTKDPYAIWVSEIMLQQTQVKTVIPYWERWMQLFPDIPSLTRAPEERVLKAWEGLGYYSRARNLQKAARQICAENDGQFPDTLPEVLSLPGIGRYTAGAICSIAFGQKTAILDGNVARVLARVFMIAGAVKASSTQTKLWARSAALVKECGDPSAFNQALMELGAMICLPRAPRCSECPLMDECRAYARGKVDRFPTPAAAPVMRQRQFVALLVEHRGRALVRRREDGVVNGGLWEFPNLELLEGEERAARIGELGLAGEFVKTLRHTITRNRITLHAFRASVNGDAQRLARRYAGEWRSPEELRALPFSSAHAKLRDLLGLDR